jgi:hypothetical protein
VARREKFFMEGAAKAAPDLLSFLRMEATKAAPELPLDYLRNWLKTVETAPVVAATEPIMGFILPKRGKRKRGRKQRVRGQHRWTDRYLGPG